MQGEELLAVQHAVLTATRSASALPGPADLQYHRALDKGFAHGLDASSILILRLVNQLLVYSSSKSCPLDAAAIADDYAEIISLTDGVLERVDRALDRSRGRSPVQAAHDDQSRRKGPCSERSSEKPQLRFTKSVDNHATVWRPLLRSKPNALQPLDLTPRMIPFEQDDGTVHECLAVPHPYLREIDAAVAASCPPSVLAQAAPTADSFALTPFTVVDTPAALQDMHEHLRTVKEVAIDLEHHDWRSYIGIVCLMQISTRERDFVIDVLNPTLRELVQDLNDVFTDRSVVKVLHGADSDVIWLQRDLGLYLVNLFDTYHASRILRFPRHSLAHLLDKYVSFKADKRLQTADWRIRPLPADMLHYARADTHYLLHVYSCLVRDLANCDEPQSEGAAPYHRVVALSAETAKRAYLPSSREHDTKWRRLLEKWHKDMEWPPTSSRYKAFRSLYDWRDEVARDEDESVHYVLTNAMLLALAQNLPTDAGKAAAYLRGGSLARARVLDIINRVARAADEESDGVIATAPEHDTSASHATIVAIKPDLWHASGPLAAPPSSLFPARQSTLPLAASSALWSRPTPLKLRSSAWLIDEIANALQLSHPKQHLELVGSASKPTASTAPSTNHVFRPRRTPSVASDSDDSVIVVKQLVKNRPSGGAQAPTQLAKAPRIEVQPHDYSATPSILDADVAASVQRQKKRKHEGKRPEPRKRQMKATQPGAQSQTF